MRPIVKMALSEHLVALFFVLAVPGLADGHETFCKGKLSTLHEDPENCSKYYSCFLGSTFSFSCPANLYFNKLYSVCDWQTNVNCERGKTKQTDPSPTSQTESTTLPSTIGNYDSEKTTVFESIVSSPVSETVTPASSISTEFPISTTAVPKEIPTSTSVSAEFTTSTASLPKSEISVSSSAADIKSADVTVEVTTPTNAMVTRTPVSLITFCHDKLDDFYPDPENCRDFYQCHRSMTYHFKCYPGLLYNSRFRYCDWEWNVNCTVRKESTLPHHNENLVEPTQSVTPVVKDAYSASNCGFVVCYVPNWAVYRSGSARFGPENVDPNMCTHIIYAFAILRGNRLAALEPSDEPSGDDVGNFARVTNLKNLNPRLKVLLALGGWNMHSSLFSEMAASKENRAEFINTTIEFLRSKNFDGLDFDWEYPSSGVYPALDKERHATLCEEIRAAFNRENSGENRLILTAAVSAGQYVIDASYDIPRLAASLDIINIMSYDLHGSWESTTGHHSPLDSGPWEIGSQANLNVKWAANYWASKGAPKSKLAVGVPFYARTFTLSSTTDSGVGAPTLRAGVPGKYTKESGFLSYFELCSIFSVSNKSFIESQRVPYLVYGSQWIGYDDPTSLKKKMNFIKENGFGGVMVWDISFDDSTGRFCGDGPYPLLNALISVCSSTNDSSTTHSSK